MIRITMSRMRRFFMLDQPENSDAVEANASEAAASFQLSSGYGKLNAKRSCTIRGQLN